MNSRTGIFTNSLHRAFHFVWLLFYLTCSCTCGEPEKSPPPSTWLIFSPRIARIDFSNTHTHIHHPTQITWHPSAPTAASWLCPLPLHPLHWCGMSPNSAPSISIPGEAWGGVGKLVAKGRGFLSLTARDTALLHWELYRFSKYFKDFAEKTLLQVRKTISQGEDPFNPVWECCVQALGSDHCHIQRNSVTFTAMPARCCTLTGWGCKWKPGVVGNGQLSVSLSSIKGSNRYPWTDCQMENICFI